MENQPLEKWLDAEPPLILIAHPDAEVRRQLAAELGDYRFCEVSDGSEVLGRTREEEPDAILANFQMPGESGLELCRKLRSDPALRWVPVALMSPSGEKSFEAATEAGASEVVAIPFTPAELRLRMRNMVQARSYRRELERKNHVVLEALRDLKESEAMLVQAEKMTLLGEMSAGIVHEINNPLNYAKSALFLLKRLTESLEEGEDRDEIEDLLSDVAEGIERVGQIIRDLRGFAVKGTLEVSEVELRSVIQTSARLIGNRINNLKYVESIPEGLLVQGNENNLCQVILNLIKNAVEATEAAGRGLEEAEIQIKGEAIGGEIVLSIRDNGCGIAEKDLASMFQPFFTTKDRGRGMGLGLSICRRILEEHGASIEVESQYGEYTEFVLRFPPVAEIEREEQEAENQSQVQQAALNS